MKSILIHYVKVLKMMMADAGNIQFCKTNQPLLGVLMKVMPVKNSTHSILADLTTTIHIVDEGNKCSQCQSCEKTIEASRKRKNAKLREPAKPNAPLSATHPMRLKLTLKDQRFKIQKLEEKIATTCLLSCSYFGSSRRRLSLVQHLVQDTTL